MKKEKFLAVAIMSALMASTFSVSAADTAPEKVTVNGAKINFTGTVVSAPCIVDNDSNNQTVNLGQVTTKAMAKKGDSSTAVPFTIKLTGCDLAATDVSDPTKSANYTKVAITFNGTTAGDDSTLALAGNGAGSSVAKNVGIQILQNNTALKVDGSTPAQSSELVTGSNEIPFSAAYVATGDNVTAGSANSSVSFQITYE